MIVMRVGGSLFDHPRLGPGLCEYVSSLDAADIRLISGGGPFADMIRQLDRAHQLGEEAAHWLALRAMSVAGSFLTALLRPGIAEDRLTVIDCLSFAIADDAQPGALPHSWAVTSDSIAARYAAVCGASRLVLLKSVEIPPETSWEEAAARGWVDTHFPVVVREHRLHVEAINFRDWLDAYAMCR